MSMVEPSTHHSAPPVPPASAERMRSTLEREARLVARKAEIDRREAALERLTRATELAKRERALTERQQLIERIETHLERSRRRLEERLRQFEAARQEPVRIGGFRRLHAVKAGYFAHGSYANEDDWWAKQLGAKPDRVAV